MSSKSMVPKKPKTDDAPGAGSDDKTADWCTSGGKRHNWKRWHQYTPIKKYRCDRAGCGFFKKCWLKCEDANTTCNGCHVIGHKRWWMQICRLTENRRFSLINQSKKKRSASPQLGVALLKKLDGSTDIIELIMNKLACCSNDNTPKMWRIIWSTRCRKVQVNIDQIHDKSAQEARQLAQKKGGKHSLSRGRISKLWKINKFFQSFGTLGQLFKISPCLAKCTIVLG